MNKLEGFYTLKESGLPTVPWQKYEAGTKLDKKVLWTIRCAVEKGEDLHLPRLVGVDSEKAEEFAENLIQKLGSNDLIIYYPFFIARKSGVLEIAEKRTVIEAVHKDLWNLVTHNKKDVTIIFDEEDMKIFGEDKFFEEEEMFELIDYSLMMKKKYRSHISNGKSIFLEWSYACKSDLHQKEVGCKSLLFYEIRTV